MAYHKKFIVKTIKDDSSTDDEIYDQCKPQESATIEATILSNYFLFKDQRLMIYKSDAVEQVDRWSKFIVKKPLILESKSPSTQSN
jgi:hypothetical protein